jgi:hypothetical protein
MSHTRAMSHAMSHTRSSTITITTPLPSTAPTCCRWFTIRASTATDQEAQLDVAALLNAALFSEQQLALYVRLVYASARDELKVGSSACCQAAAWGHQPLLSQDDGVRDMLPGPRQRLHSRLTALRPECTLFGQPDLPCGTVAASLVEIEAMATQSG